MTPSLTATFPLLFATTEPHCILLQVDPIGQKGDHSRDHIETPSVQQTAEPCLDDSLSGTPIHIERETLLILRRCNQSEHLTYYLFKGGFLPSRKKKKGTVFLSLRHIKN